LSSEIAHSDQLVGWSAYDEGAVQRARYMSLETIAHLSDAPIVSLPTLAA